MQGNCRGPFGAVGLLTAFAVSSIFLAGCSNSQSSQQALDAQLKTLNIKKAALGKFAGKVYVDGQPPAVKRGQTLVVMLYDREHPDKNKPPRYVACAPDGGFAFYTYAPGDGVPPGTYVVLFAELKANRRKGFLQPDALNNLYDDPDKNAQNKDFVVAVEEAGKSDYDFRLDVAGKEAGKPGPHAVTEIIKN